MTENTWKDYFERTKNSRPRPVLIKALEFVKQRIEALDLGAGALNDVRYLVSVGFKHITAVDQEPLAKDIIKDFPEKIVAYVVSNFDEFSFPDNTYDLINAQYSLPFNSKDSFNQVWSRIISSLKPEGVLTGQLFGVNDEWNKGGTQMNFHTRENAEKLLSSLKLVEFREEENDSPTAAGDMKHWHVFHFIAIK